MHISTIIIINNLNMQFKCPLLLVTISKFRNSLDLNNLTHHAVIHFQNIATKTEISNMHKYILNLNHRIASINSLNYPNINQRFPAE